MGIMGIKMSNIPGSGLPDGAPTGKEAEQILAGEMLSAFRNYQQTTTEFIARLAGRLTNNVLWSGSMVFDASGIITRQFGTPIGSLKVRNTSATVGHVVTVISGASGGIVAPVSGLGVFPINPGVDETCDINAREITVFGTPGDLIILRAFSVGDVAQDAGA